MGDIQPFEQLLDATIKAPRLSGTKVTQLSELAMSLVANDHDLVTTFFKLNNSLPPATQARISSLYVFDAIARAARNAVNKGKGREVRTERGKGTQGSLLVKLEGVVASWVNGMVEDGKGGIWSEGKEKVRKIIDIWAKHGTFPQACLDELNSKIANAAPQAGPSSGSTSTPLGARGKQALDQGSTTPPLPPPVNAAISSVAQQTGGLPPEILKMLGIAAPPQATTIASPNASNHSASAPTQAPPAALPIAAPHLGAIDIQALLASVKQAPLPPAFNNVNNGIPPTQASSATYPAQLAQMPTPVHGGNPNLNQNQVNALAKFAALAQAGPTPPQGGVGARPDSTPHHGIHIQQPPALGAGAGPGYGHDRGPDRYDPQSSQPPRRESRDNRSPIRNTHYGGYGQDGGMTAESSRNGPPDRRGHSPPRRSSRNDGASGPLVGYGQGAYFAGSHGRQQFVDQRRGGGRGTDMPQRGGYESGPPGRYNQGEGRNGFGGQVDGPAQRGGYGHNSTRGGRPGGSQGPGYGGRDRSRSPPRRDGPSGRGRFGDRPSFDGRDSRQGVYGNDEQYPASQAQPAPHSQSQSQSQSQLQAAPSNGGTSGRAPPPDWMKDGDDDNKASAITGGSEDKGSADDGGEVDMALDDSDDEEGRQGGGSAGVSAFNSTKQKQADPTQHSQMPFAQVQPSFLPQPPSFTQDPAPISNSFGQQGNLDSFDMTSFDPSSPEAWAHLAQAWKVSTGSEPDQMMLMNWVMMRMQGGGQ